MEEIIKFQVVCLAKNKYKPQNFNCEITSLGNSEHSISVICPFCGEKLLIKEVKNTTFWVKHFQTPVLILLFISFVYVSFFIFTNFIFALSYFYLMIFYNLYDSAFELHEKHIKRKLMIQGKSHEVKNETKKLPYAYKFLYWVLIILFFLSIIFQMLAIWYLDGSLGMLIFWSAFYFLVFGSAVFKFYWANQRI